MDSEYLLEGGKSDLVNVRRRLFVHLSMQRTFFFKECHELASPTVW